MKSEPALWLIGLFFAFFPVFFVALWTAVVFAISRIAWSPLAGSFSALHTPTGTKFHMVSAFMKGCRYKGCLTAIVAPEGLWMKPWWIFSMFHPALLIPWNAFAPFEEQKMWWGTQSTTLISTPTGQQIELHVLPKSLENAMRQHMGGATGRVEVQPPSGPWSG